MGSKVKKVKKVRKVKKAVSELTFKDKEIWLLGFIMFMKSVWFVYIWCIDRLNGFSKRLTELDMQKQIDNPFTSLFVWHLLCGLLLMGYLFAYWQGYFVLPFTPQESLIHNIVMFTWGVCFLRSAYLDWRYQHRLSFMAPRVLKNSEIPLSHEQLANHPSKPDLYVGDGFDWTVKHRQLLYTLQQERNNKKNKWVNLIYEAKHRKFMDTARPLAIVPFMPYSKRQSLSDLRKKYPTLDSCLKAVGFPMIPDLGGKALYHGLEKDNGYAIWATESNRASHGCIIGTTGSGKTVGFNTLMIQDIRKGRLVIYLDPKGDLDTLINMFCAALDAGRIDDFMVIHAGQHDLSAKANFFGNFSDVSQVANRMTSSLSQGGSGQNFTEESWMAINQVAQALHEIDVKIDPASLRFYVSRPIELLRRYCEKVYPPLYPDFHEKVEKFSKEYLKQAKEEKKEITKMQARNMAILKYVQLKQDELNDETSGIEIDHIGMSNRIDFDLYEITKNDEKYRRKMISSVFPLLSKINNTKQSSMFSYYQSDLLKKNEDGSYYQDKDGNYYKRKEYNVKEMLDNPVRNQIVYIGISSLANKILSETMVRAFLQDLTNCAGVLNDNGRKAGKDGQGAYIFIDEMAEVATESAIQLLNKARGTGIRVTWATQTISDIVVAFKGDKDKAKQILANSQGFKILFRLKDNDYTKLILESFDKVTVKGVVQESGVIDKSVGDFRTTNGDRIQTVETSLLTHEMLTSLPNGHAIFINAANEAYKVVFPIVVSDDEKFANYVLSDEVKEDRETEQGRKNIRFIMEEVNEVKISAEEAQSYMQEVEKINQSRQGSGEKKEDEVIEAFSFDTSRNEDVKDDGGLFISQEDMGLSSDGFDDDWGDGWDDDFKQEESSDTEALSNINHINNENNISSEKEVSDMSVTSVGNDIVIEEAVKKQNTLIADGKPYTNSELNNFQDYIIDNQKTNNFGNHLLIMESTSEILISFKHLAIFAEKVMMYKEFDDIYTSLSIFMTRKVRVSIKGESLLYFCFKYGNFLKLEKLIYDKKINIKIFKLEYEITEEQQIVGF
ncbi:conjugative transfer system coupling protein TraD [Cysteiniphilum marinum]|uniref:conjugative transfer system coupling protein TraD n=1 Tax=Cysteiniphilum marinum TaxID=2774191 RepID=UPI00193A1839|nr:conjugative transfer system coupling protein TraD [Cysteiniphilum marinum]